MGWVNHVLSSVGGEPVVDMVEEFRDGVVLGAFVEALVGTRIKVFFFVFLWEGGGVCFGGFFFVIFLLFYLFFFF